MNRVARALGALILSLYAASCTPPPKAPRARPPSVLFGKAPGSPDTQGWFRPQRGSEIVAVEAGVAGDRVATLVDLPETSCAVFIGRATDTVEDLDLLAYGEDGAVLGMDEGPDKTPALLICPPHPTRVYVAARIAAGHGLVAIGVERMPPAEAENAANRYHARHRNEESDARLASWPGLAERIALHRQRLGGKWTDVRRVAVPLDARIPTRLSATVEANRCLHALVLPGEELSRIELSALDDSGHILGRAAALGHDRSLVVCSPLTSVLSFELRPQGGRGLAVLVLSQSEPGSPGTLENALRIERYATGTLEEARERAAAHLAGLGYAEAKLVKTGTLQLGRLDSATFTLQKGCSRIDILTGAPVRDVSARLWAADDTLIAETEESAAPVLFACSSGGQVRLDTESLARPGPYSIELRFESETGPLLPASPLAASRLLAYLLEHGLIHSGSQAGKISHHELSPEHLTSVRFLVPLGRCVDLTLALGTGSTGAEVRLIDETSGEELALERGRNVTSARACALDARSAGTTHARAEFRVSAGHGEALSAMHSFTPAQ